MKFIAVIDEEMLGCDDIRELRLPVILEDAKCYVPLKPIFHFTLTSPEGESVYLSQKHIDALRELAEKEEVEHVIKAQQEFDYLWRNRK